VKGINKLLSEKNNVEVITVNKNRFTEFFKGKGYYVLLFIGVLAIAAVAIVGSQLSSNQGNEDQNYVDLNDTEDNLAAEDGDTQLAENDPLSEGIANNPGNSTDNVVTNEGNSQDLASNQDQVELEDYTDDAEVGMDEAQTAGQTGSEVAQTEEEQAVETAGSTVQADTTAILDNLSFSADDELLWPVNGNVIMNYSMDHTIYFATLMQYKVNPAIIIDAEVGTEVKSAAKGVVTSIDADNEETGYTITMGIGDGYSLIYGQLNKDSVSLKVGDTVNAGDVIGTVSEPTKYYTVEGSNLYFQVMNNDKNVNPMLLLR
jgi:murein DD-endopeptidase MepM/ murein hydrolase activator NlpD